MTNKDPKEGKPVWELVPVKMPIRMDCDYSYYAVFNMQDWAAYDENRKQVEVFDVLCSISRDSDGKIVPFDLKGHRIVYRNLGVDFRNKAVPNILADDFKLQKE